MAVKYLDNAGTQYLVNKIKAIDGKIPTESQITTMITTALNTYKEGIVTIVESLPQTGEEGKLYLLIDPSDSDVYIVYTWEENAFKRMGSKTFTLTVDSALSSTSTNPVQNKVIKSALDGKANASHTHGSITNDGKLGTASRVVITGTDKKIGVSTVTTTELGYLSGVTSAIQTQLDGKSATGHTHTAGDVAGLATVATSGSYNDLSNKPTINDSTITIQKNGSLVGTFTVNGSAKTIDIPVPTKTSDLNNDSNFVDTSNSAVASGITSAKVTSYDSHIADTDIHVTTADKTKWNNGVSQAYVFRYSGTAVVPNSTIAYSTIDNTDNIKSGDKILDVDGKLFEITAVDTTNQTVTVGSALIDLALDANVVHTSGNETIDGNKTFSKYITSDGSSTGDEYSNNARTNLWLLGNRDTEDVSGVLFDTFRQNTAQGTGLHILGFGIKENSVRYEGCRFSWLWDNNLSGYTFDFKPTTQGTNQAVKHNLGTSTDKWSEVHATTYYYGSSDTEFSQKFITTDTAQSINGNKNFIDNIVVKKIVSNVSQLQINAKTNADSVAMIGGDSASEGGGIWIYGKNHTNKSNVTLQVYDTDNSAYHAVRLNMDGSFTPTVSNNGLGNSSYKWVSFNGINPGALSLPDLNNGVDISGYITVNGGNKESLYTPPANGWVSVRLSRTSGSFAVLLIQGGMASAGRDTTTESGVKTADAMLPVVGGVQVSINSALADGVVSAYFYPCQGNI